MLTKISVLQITTYLLTLLILIKPLGWYIAEIYETRLFQLNHAGFSLEKLLYRLCKIQYNQEMNWKQYLSAMLLFNVWGLLAVYGIERVQFYLPINPQNFSAPTTDLAFNTAASFVTNTNWQAYGGETTMSYLTQMLAFTTQNFLSAATGMSLLVALIRGLAKHNTKNLGNFWVDTVRGTLYILLPLSFIFALILVSQGVIQNFKPNQRVTLIQPISYSESITGLTATANPVTPDTNHLKTITEQVIPMGPVASQLAIKQLGTNGGGFFNVNSAHPFENPTPLTNFLEMLALLLIPAAFCYTFGLMVNNKLQGWMLLIVMYIIMIPCIAVTVIAEQRGNPALTQLGIANLATENSYPGGNMEGKETRFGITNSALWATATTASSNGSVNSMHDSYMPIGGLMPLWMMQLGEVIFGGVGSGLYNMVMLIIITVFVSGLMVGRTPEYLGKKIEPFEMKMASIAVLVMPFIVLISTAIAVVSKAGISSIANPGTHGLTEIVYAFSSMGNNNGSSFAGLNANTPFYNILGGIVILIGRYWIAIPLLAMAGSLAQKKIIPNSSGTLVTHTPIFMILLISVIILIGALSFLPVLALGPIVEQLMIWREYGY